MASFNVSILFETPPDIDAKQRLVVNLEKLFYSDFGKNREFLEQNYFVPTKAYVLDKE